MIICKIACLPKLAQYRFTFIENDLEIVLKVDMNPKTTISRRRLLQVSNDNLIRLSKNVAQLFDCGPCFDHLRSDENPMVSVKPALTETLDWKEIPSMSNDSEVGD